MKNKKILSIVFVLLVTLTGVPAFGQQTSAAANENEKDPFFTVNALFSYFPSFVQKEWVVITDPVYPYGFAPAPGYSIQLGMGLKLFNSVNAFLDFGLDDPKMSKAMNIAGKIGTDYFDVIYSYKSTSFPERVISMDVLKDEDYAQWIFPQAGDTLGSKFNVGTLALMGPQFFEAFQAGFIWNSINANLGVQSEKKDSLGRYTAYLDTDRSFNTYGLRLGLDYTDLYKFPHLTGNEGIGKLKLIGNTYIDFSWGNVTLTDKAVEAVGFSSNKKSFTYIVIRGNFGLAWEKGFSAAQTQRSVTYGFGLDFFGTGIKFKDSKYDAVNDPAVFGIFVLVGLAL